MVALIGRPDPGTVRAEPVEFFRRRAARNLAEYLVAYTRIVERLPLDLTDATASNLAGEADGRPPR